MSSLSTYATGNKLDYASPFISPEDLCKSAGEGDAEAVALALLQLDPPLDANEATEHGISPIFSAFKMLLEVEDAQDDMEKARLRHRQQQMRNGTYVSSSNGSSSSSSRSSSSSSSASSSGAGGSGRSKSSKSSNKSEKKKKDLMKVAIKRNIELRDALQETVSLLVHRGADVELCEEGDGKVFNARVQFLKEMSPDLKRTSLRSLASSPK